RSPRTLSVKSPFWQRRANVWRKATSPARGKADKKPKNRVARSQPHRCDISMPDHHYEHSMKSALIGILLLSTTTALAQESTIRILRPPQAGAAPTTPAAPTDIRTILQDAQADCFKLLKGDPRLPKGADGANSPENVLAFNWCMNNIKMLLEQHELTERLKN